jgi:hypothetical protein
MDNFNNKIHEVLTNLSTNDYEKRTFNLKRWMKNEHI